MDGTFAYRKLTRSWALLKLAYGLFFIATGADKFFNLITNWSKYVSPSALKLLHINPDALLPMVGIIELIIGLLILIGSTRFGSFLASVWLTIIVINLVSMGTYSFSPEIVFRNPYLDIIMYDILLAIGACTLGAITEVRRRMLYD